MFFLGFVLSFGVYWILGRGYVWVLWQYSYVSFVLVCEGFGYYCLDRFLFDLS